MTTDHARPDSPPALRAARQQLLWNDHVPGCRCGDCLPARFVVAVCEPDDTLIEAVAQALAKADGDPWTGLSVEAKGYWCNSARATLAAVAQTAGGKE